MGKQVVDNRARGNRSRSLDKEAVTSSYATTVSEGLERVANFEMHELFASVSRDLNL